MHPADVVRTNSISLATILNLFRGPPFNAAPNAGALDKERLDSQPDILNLTKRHLYEIKPKTQRTLGKEEADWYVESLTMAGIPVTLGPVGELGTIGAVPAPGGIYLFECKDPGVILYEYKRQQVAKQPAESTEPGREPGWAVLPLTKAQHDQVTTDVVVIGVGGAILLFLAGVLDFAFG